MAKINAMYQGLLHAHSGLRWVVLIAILYAIYQSFVGKKSGTKFSDSKMAGTMAVASIHLQFVLGLAIYFQSPWYQMLKNMGASVMSDSVARFYTVEHPIMMLIAVLVATIGNAKAKKAGTDVAAFKKRLVWFSIALLVIIIAIPWPFRFANAAWF